jgi:hypothetical protein
MLSKWKAGFAAAAVSVAIVGGAGVPAAHADNGWEATYVYDQTWKLQNLTGQDRSITDMFWVSGDIGEVYHWNFGCVNQYLAADDYCFVWGDGTSGVLGVVSAEAGEEDVTITR